jgi:SRSO17 transposase
VLFRSPTHPVATAARVAAATLLDALPATAWRAVSWRRGTKGPLGARFAALRVRVADGPPNARGQHQPGQAVWLVGERRTTGERKFYLTNHPAGTPLATLVATLKARWVCEQAHQQLKQQLGLGHFQGRSWAGLHHHALLALLAFAFLQHLRLLQAAEAPVPPHGPPPQPTLPAVRRALEAALVTGRRCPLCAAPRREEGGSTRLISLRSAEVAK